MTLLSAVCFVLALAACIWAPWMEKRIYLRAVQRKADADRAANLQTSIAELERLVSVPMETLIADAEQVAVDETRPRPRTHAEQHYELHDLLRARPTGRIPVLGPPDCDDCGYEEICAFGSVPIRRILTDPCSKHGGPQEEHRA
jgi:hypothetical protein